MNPNTSSRQSLCVTIDLDDLRYYRAIHGLPEGSDTPLVFEAAIPRFLDFCEKLNIKATLFVIGMDMRWESAGKALRSATARGHEVASHSFSHFYDLSRMAPSDIDNEVRSARTRIEDAAGVGVVGFRGPGYNLSNVLLEAVSGAGYEYDSSVLPAPAYFMARAAVIAGMRLRGHHSASITGRARDFFQTNHPFEWGAPAQGLKEFPISACGPCRIPLIGTTLAGGGHASNLLLKSAARRPFLNVEFHAIDFLGVRRDSIERELRVEPVLKVPLSKRIRNFEKALQRLKEKRHNTLLARLQINGIDR